MKKTLSAAILLMVTLLGVAGAKEMNVLFIGNSFTFRHNLPELVKTVFEEGQSDLTVNVDICGYGGQDLFRHHDLYFTQSMVRLNTITIPEVEAYRDKIQTFLEMEQAPDFYQEYWVQAGLKPQPWEKLTTNSLKVAVKRQGRLIERLQADRRMKWDYVVLQSWQDIVEEPDAGYAEYAKKFTKLAAEEGAEVILYITAPYSQNQAPVQEPVQPERVEKEIQAIHALAAEIKPHAVVPVPLAIQAIQEGGTDLTFRYVNDFHPNQTTAFLTANMFYAAFFKESPEGFAFDSVTENNDKGQGEGKDPDGGDATVVFDDTTKTKLQQAAYDAVVTFNSNSKTNL